MLIILNLKLKETRTNFWKNSFKPRPNNSKKVSRSISLSFKDSEKSTDLNLKNWGKAAQKCGIWSVYFIENLYKILLWYLLSKLKQKTDGSGSGFSKSGSAKKAVSIRIQERVLICYKEIGIHNCFRGHVDGNISEFILINWFHPGIHRMLILPEIRPAGSVGILISAQPDIRGIPYSIPP